MVEKTEEEVSTRILTIPNVISAARLSLVPIFVWIFLTRRNDVISFVLLAVIGSTDWVDGFLARRLGQVSRLGKILDPIADRIAVVALLLSLTFRGTVAWQVASVIILRDLIVAIVFPILEARGFPRIEVNFVGKAATASIYSGVGLSALSLIVPPAQQIHAAGSVLLWLGAALYWSAGVLYVKEIVRIARTRTQP